MIHCPAQTKQFYFRTDFLSFAASRSRFHAFAEGYPTFKEQRSKDKRAAASFTVHKPKKNCRADIEMNFDGVEKLTANPTSHAGVLTPVGGVQGHRQSSSSRRHSNVM